MAADADGRSSSARDTRANLPEIAVDSATHASAGSMPPVSPMTCTRDEHVDKPACQAPLQRELTCHLRCVLYLDAHIQSLVQGDRDTAAAQPALVIWAAGV